MNGKRGLLVPLKSRFGPFRYLTFAIVWIAHVAGLIGIAMFDAATGWLMTTLNADPLTVSLVQTAFSVPIFLLIYPAGALADIVDPRRFLIGVSASIIGLISVFAMIVSLDLATPALLLTTIFVLSGAWAINAPAWLSILPSLVPREELDSAVAASGVGYNISRALGPALGGLAIAWIGIAAPFWIFCAANVYAIVALTRWRPAPNSGNTVHAAGLASGLRLGLRHATNSGLLRAILMRALAIYPFMSAFSALLPLIARQTVPRPEFYTAMLGMISLGAIAGSLALGSLKSQLGVDRLIAVCTVAASSALVTLAVSHATVPTLTACFILGGAWIAAQTSLYVLAQDALPARERGRGLGILLTVVYGAISFSAVAWGQLASMHGMSVALYAAAVGALMAIPLTWHWKLQTGASQGPFPVGG